MNTSRTDKMRKKRNKEKKITYKMQANFLLAFGIVVAALFLLIGVLIKINVKDGDKYAKRVLSQQSYTSSDIPFKRGDIVDRNNVIMATSIKKYDLAIDVSFSLTKSKGEYLYREDVKKVLVDYFKINENEVEGIFTERAKSQYYIIEKEVPTKIVDGYEEYLEETFKDPNPIKRVLWFEEEYIRRYPLKDVASSVIGFTFDKNQGNWGIEEKYNSDLNGSTGRVYGYFDSNLNLERTVKNAEDGNTIVSTIDSNIQGIVEKHIKKFQEDVGSKNTAVVMADPNTGEILAMASSNGIYDLNKPRDLSRYYEESEIEEMTNEQKLDALNLMWRNFCVSDTYEPGSTYKPFIVAAALEEDKTKVSDTFYCDGGEVVASGTSRIRCANRSGHGSLDLAGVLMASCNDGMMKMAKQMGRGLFADYQTHFNFGKKTGIDLNGESPGIIYYEDNLGPVELATCSFGQGLNVTMTQMVAGFSALVNGGNYYEPHVVSKIVNAQGGTVKRFDPVLKNRVITKDTSKFICDAMKKTVENGTARHAQLEGYTVGGKTGTAQKLPRGTGKYLVSFIGCAPTEDPEVVIYAIVDEPDVDNQAQSSFAQGLCRDILKEVLPFLEVYSTIESKENVEDNEEDEKKKEDDDEEEDNEPVNDASVMDESGNAFDNITTDVQNNTDAIINEEEEKKKKTDNDDDSDEDSEDDSDNDSRNNSNSNSSSGDEFSDELDIG